MFAGIHKLYFTLSLNLRDVFQVIPSAGISFEWLFSKVRTKHKPDPDML